MRDITIDLHVARNDAGASYAFRTRSLIVAGKVRGSFIPGATARICAVKAMTEALTKSDLPFGDGDTIQFRISTDGPGLENLVSQGSGDQAADAAFRACVRQLSLKGVTFCFDTTTEIDATLRTHGEMARMLGY